MMLAMTKTRSLDEAKRRAFEGKNEMRLARIFSKHPFLAFALLFIMVPVGVIFAVTLFTAILALPVALFLG